MPKKIPAYCHHKTKGLAYVILDGKQVYLGTYHSPESHQRYERSIAEWLSQRHAPLNTEPATFSRGGCPSPAAASGFTVLCLCDAYWHWAEQYYQAPGGSPGQVARIKTTLRGLLRLYADTPVDAFTPSALRAVQAYWVQKGHARTQVNNLVNCARRVFKWGVAHDQVHPETFQRLQLVDGLRAGKTEAPESEPVRPVADEALNAVYPHLTSITEAMLRLVRHTGARPAEICALTPEQVDCSGPIWVYTPHTHKTQHHGVRRSICLGPKAQAVLRPFLLRDGSAYCFDPREAVREGNRKGHPASRGRRPRQQPNPTIGHRKVRDHYTPSALCTALRRACDRAGIERFTVMQIRHTRATEIRSAHGLDAAQAALNHTHATTTEIYAEVDLEKAKAAAQASG